MDCGTGQALSSQSGRDTHCVSIAGAVGHGVRARLVPDGREAFGPTRTEHSRPVESWADGVFDLALALAPHTVIGTCS